MRAEETALIDLLETEREALRRGRLDRIGDLGEAKLRLAAAVLAAPADAEALAGIGRRLRRNERLLAAALAGLGEAGQRLSGIRDGARGFATYAPDGSGTTIATPGRPAFERRA